MEILILFIQLRGPIIILIKTCKVVLIKYENLLKNIRCNKNNETIY